MNTLLISPGYGKHGEQKKREKSLCYVSTVIAKKKKKKKNPPLDMMTSQ